MENKIIEFNKYIEDNNLWHISLYEFIQGQYPTDMKEIAMYCVIKPALVKALAKHLPLSANG